MEVELGLSVHVPASLFHRQLLLRPLPVAVCLGICLEDVPEHWLQLLHQHWHFPLIHIAAHIALNSEALSNSLAHGGAGVVLCIAHRLSYMHMRTER